MIVIEETHSDVTLTWTSSEVADGRVPCQVSKGRFVLKDGAVQIEVEIGGGQWVQAYVPGAILDALQTARSIDASLNPRR